MVFSPFQVTWSSGNVIALSSRQILRRTHDHVYCDVDTATFSPADLSYVEEKIFPLLFIAKHHYNVKVDQEPR